MSAPVDEGPPTTPTLPPDEEPIAKGKAQASVTAAVLDVLNAVSRLEAIANAVARALDESHPTQPKTESSTP